MSPNRPANRPSRLSDLSITERMIGFSIIGALVGLLLGVLAVGLISGTLRLSNVVVTVIAGISAGAVTLMLLSSHS